MARINIDDSLHADARFKRLVRRLGDEDKAVGMLYRFWRLAIMFWGEGKKLIPQSEFEAEELGVLWEVGFAEQRQEGIYAFGAEERFSWYTQRKEAGRKRAGAKRDSAGQFTSGTTIPDQPPAPAPAPAPAPDRNTALTGLAEAKAAWKGTLEAWGHTRNLGMGEERTIALALQQETPELVIQALTGARHEPIVKDFNPARAPDIARVLGEPHRGRAGKPSQVAKFAGYAPAPAAEEVDPYA